MNAFIKANIPYLACPQCQGLLKDNEDVLICQDCELSYGYDKSGRLQITIQQPKSINLNFNLLPDCYRERDYPSMPENLDGVFNNSKELPGNSIRFFNSMPCAENPDACCLDIGCGALTKKTYVEKAGYKYLGFDCDDPSTQIIGDAHAIPYQSERFDLATAHVVMEHFRYPWVVIEEIFRILKPGGFFHGRVAFLECFHDSYYHMTHWAVSSLLENAGFKIIWLEPDVNNLWHVLQTMFPRIPGSLIRTSILPIMAAHKIWFKLGSKILNSPQKNRDNFKWRLPGGIMFLAQKNLKP